MRSDQENWRLLESLYLGAGKAQLYCLTAQLLLSVVERSLNSLMQHCDARRRGLSHPLLRRGPTVRSSASDRDCFVLYINMFTGKVGILLTISCLRGTTLLHLEPEFDTTVNLCITRSHDAPVLSYYWTNPLRVRPKVL